MIRRSGRPGLLGTMARTAVVAGTASAVVGRVQGAQAQHAQVQAEAAEFRAQQQRATLDEAARRAVEDAQAQARPQPEAAPTGGSAATDLMAQLQQLATLHAQGVLTDAEFSAAKAKLLS